MILLLFFYFFTLTKIDQEFKIFWSFQYINHQNSVIINSCRLFIILWKQELFVFPNSRLPFLARKALGKRTTSNLFPADNQKTWRISSTLKKISPFQFKYKQALDPCKFCCNTSLLSSNRNKTLSIKEICLILKIVRRPL